MAIYLSIAAGGALGALCRYVISGLVERRNPFDLPVGTLLVNTIGGFLVGVLFILMAEKLQLGENLRPVLMTGFLGGLTTFSAFSLETLLLFERGNHAGALAYVALSVGCSLGAAWLGMQLARAAG